MQREVFRFGESRDTLYISRGKLCGNFSGYAINRISPIIQRICLNFNNNNNNTVPLRRTVRAGDGAAGNVNKHVLYLCFWERPRVDRLQ